MCTITFALSCCVQVDVNESTRGQEGKTGCGVEVDAKRKQAEVSPVFLSP